MWRLSELGLHIQDYYYDAEALRLHLRIGYVVMIISAIATLYFLQGDNTLMAVYPVMTGTITFYYLFMIRNAFDLYDVSKVFPGVELFAFGVVLRTRRNADPIPLLWDDILEVFIEYDAFKIVAKSDDNRIRPTVSYRIQYLMGREALLAEIVRRRSEHLQSAEAPRNPNPATD